MSFDPSAQETFGQPDPPKSGSRFWLDGMFEGKQGPAMLMGQVNAENFSEDDAENLLRSIK